MDTNRLKRFATEARNILLTGVLQRLSTLGFDIETGTASEEPQKFEGGAVFMGDTVSEEFYNQWTSLNKNIQERGVKDVVEEAAYTWFNRLIAIRILSKQGFIEPVLQYDSERTPVIVTEARQGRVPSMDDDTRRRFEDVVDDDSMTNEQFAILIVAFCHSNSIISKCFGSISDYTELLLPSNILSSGGFVDMLNDSELITDEDYHSAELIGWLYQFYISEKKDEVFAKKGKVEADEIPAATQIFTPNWIVKYMVQNTVGRIYLDNDPYATELKEKWEYLVEGEPTPEDKIYKFNDLTELKVGDLACGSGHILVECFDLLFDLYLYEGYSRKDAVENIFKYNLTGIDIDKRAKQLATFALILKACQKDKSFISAHSMPNVLTIPHCNEYTWRELGNHFCCQYNIQEPHSKENIDDAFQLLEEAENLGSIMKFNLTKEEMNFIINSIKSYEANKIESYEELINGFKIILALTQQYTSLVMNPPYMGSGNMNVVLSNYVKKHYKDTKSDLMTVFMEVSDNLTAINGKYSMINLPSWLFLSSFETLRRHIIDNRHIDSLLHMGRGIFGIDWGSTSFTISKCKYNNNGVYFKLHKRNFQHIYYIHIKQLFEQTLQNHNLKFDFDTYRDEDVTLINNYKFEHSEQGVQIYYKQDQDNFNKLPGSTIGYWVNDKIYETFTSNLPLSAVANPCVGLQTADNGRFLRQWFEVDFRRIGLNYKNAASAADSHKKWFPYNKGGSFRKWYGNQEYVVNWENDGFEIKNFKGSVIRNPKTYFHKSVSWSKISAGNIAFRLYPEGFIYDVAGTSLFFNNESEIDYFISLINSKVISEILKTISPTLNFEVGQIATLPIIYTKSKTIEERARQNIQISQLDWDAHETSWNFISNEIIKLANNKDNITTIDIAKQRIMEYNTLPVLFEIYKDQWTNHFNQLHSNEEELNRQLINIYKLEDELTPDVPLDEITILQQGEIKIKDNKIEFQPDVIIKQLISYAVGCMMGRYSVDKEGLILANQGDGLKEFDELVPNAKYRPDDDGIIHLMDADSNISDNASTRFKKWLSVTFGEDSLIENLNFVEKCLGKSIDSYFEKDFWKDHKKMYQNRPIYWLFSSKKGAFQCLAYMHRMNPYTAERVRTQYLLPHIEFLMKRQQELMEESAVLSTMERKELDNITKQIDECREYHERLHVIADEQIGFDLDDGVVVNYAKFGDVLAKLK